MLVKESTGCYLEPAVLFRYDDYFLGMIIPSKPRYIYIYIIKLSTSGPKITPLRGMFPPLGFLMKLWIELVTIELFCDKFIHAGGIFYRCVIRLMSMWCKGPINKISKTTKDALGKDR